MTADIRLYDFDSASFRRFAPIRANKNAVIPPVTPSNPTPLTLQPKIGVYRSYNTSASALAAYETFLGRQVDYVLEFQGTESQGNLGWPNYMRTHFNPTFMGSRKLMLGASLSPVKRTVEPYDRIQTWQQLADGLFDATWTAMATNLVADGLGSSVLRGAHEFNEPMFAHKVYPGEEAAFIAAWRRWHDIIMAVPGADFHFNWNPTTGDYNGNGLDTVACYPGDAYVDTIDLDLYDRWYPRGSTPAAPRTLSEQTDKWNEMLTRNEVTWRGLNYWRAFAVSHGKGMGFSEWGTGSYFNDGSGNHGGGDNEVFMNGMADFILNPAYPPGEPGGVVDHAFWEDGIEGVMPLALDNPDAGRAIPVPKMRAIFKERFGTGGVDPAHRNLSKKFYTNFSEGYLPDVFEPLGGGKTPAYGGNAYLQTDGSGNPYNKEMQWMRPDCVRIQNSGYSNYEGNVLALTTKAEPYTTTFAGNRTDLTFDYLAAHPNPGAGRDANGNPRYPYRAGMVSTQGARHTPGQPLTVSGSKEWSASARMRWTQADGYWPAFWMLAEGQSTNPVFAWVTEYDIMEDFSPRVFGANKVVANMFKSGTQLQYNNHKVRDLDLSKFHTWVMHHNPTGSTVTAGQSRITLRVDGELFFDSDFYRNLGLCDETWFYKGNMHFIFQGAQIGGTGSNGSLTEGQAGWRDLSAAAVAALPLRMEISNFGVWEAGATAVTSTPVIGHPALESPTRTALVEPFAADSPFNLGRAVDATLESTSSPRTASMVNFTGVVWAESGDYTHRLDGPTTTSDPLATFHRNDGNQPDTTAYVKPTYLPMVGSDKHLHVMQPDAKTVIETWVAEKQSDTYFTVGRWAKVDYEGSGIGPQNGTRAYGGSSMGGIIRSFEVDPTHPLYTGVIDHAVSLMLPFSLFYYNEAATDFTNGSFGYGYYGGGTVTSANQASFPGWAVGTNITGFMKTAGYVWPATEQDYSSPGNYAGLIPMGGYFTIPNSVNVDSLNLTWAGKMLAKAYQDYGGYVADTVGGSNTVTLCTVEPNSIVGGKASTANSFMDTLLNAGVWNAPDLKEIIKHLRLVTSNSSVTPNGGAIGAARRGKPKRPFA